jgi:uncharacterized membrane protein YphA (DoxX/SURF4 family)
VAKALDRQDAILAVDAYKVLPAALVRPVAMALPWLEIAVGLFLVLGLFIRFSGVAAGLLTLVFVAALSQAKARGLPIDCGCFGGGGPGSGVTWFDIVRDLPLLAAGAYLAVLPGRWLQLDRLFAQEEELHEPPTDLEEREEPHTADEEGSPKALVGPAKS